MEGFRSSRRGISRGSYGGSRGSYGRYHRGSYGIGREYRNRHYGYNYNLDYPWYYPWFLHKGACKNGCGDLGNGTVGCIDPGYGFDNCVFASDCYGC